MHETGSEKEHGGPLTRAKRKVQDYVADLAEKYGINKMQLVFKWVFLDGITLPEHGIEIDQKLCILTVYRGKNSQALTFIGPDFSRIHDDPEKFLSNHERQFIAVLRKLKRETVPAASGPRARSAG